MVYCTKCGTKNPDDAKVCTQCGESLYPGAYPTQRYERRREEECFGLPRGGAIAGLFFGVIIILVGTVFLLQQTGVIVKYLETFWPLILIAFGILVLAGGLYGLRRRP